MNLCDGHFLTTHLQVQLSNTQILACIIICKSNLNSLLTRSTIDYKTILCIILSNLTPDFVRRETPALVRIECKLLYFTGCTRNGLYLWEHRNYGIVVIA